MIDTQTVIRPSLAQQAWPEQTTIPDILKGSGEVRIAGFGGTMNDAQIKAYYEPFEKISGRWWAMRGDDFTAEDYAPHRIEVLASGQQFVAFARHPRGSYYRWRRYSPISIIREALPPITEHEARAFFATAEGVLKGVGALPIKRIRGTWYRDVEQKQPNRRRVVLGDRPPSEWQLLDPAALAKAIDAKHATRTRNGWITSCPAHSSEGHRSLSVNPREGGGSVVHCWAECSFADIAHSIEAIVGRAA